MRYINHATGADLTWQDTDFTRGKGYPAVEGCWGFGHGGHHRYMAPGATQLPPRNGWQVRRDGRHNSGAYPLPTVATYYPISRPQVSPPARPPLNIDIDNNVDVNVDTNTNVEVEVSSEDESSSETIVYTCAIFAGFILLSLIIRKFIKKFNLD